MEVDSGDRIRAGAQSTPVDFSLVNSPASARFIGPGPRCGTYPNESILSVLSDACGVKTDLCFPGPIGFRLCGL